MSQIAESNPHELPIPFGWYGIAYSGELASGEIKNLHYFSRELVLFRTESGVAQVVDPYCPHLGAHLGHGGSVQGEHIACPFHGWQFDKGGVCQHIPYAKRIPPKIEGVESLPSYPTVERNGVIWAWYHPAGEAPLFDVFEIEEMGHPDWSDCVTFEWEIDTHLQEAAENAADAAHFAFVHNAEDVPVGEVTHDGYSRNAHFSSRTPNIDEQGNVEADNFIDTELDTNNRGPGQTWQRFTGLFDTIMLGVVTPITSNRFHLRFAFIQRRDITPIQQMMAKGMVDEIARQVEQDIPIWNNKIYRPQPVLCDGDGPINQFRKWFSQFYAD